MKSLDVALESMTMLLDIKQKCQDADRLWQVEELVDAAIERVEIIIALERHLEIFNRRLATEVEVK